MSIRGNVFLGGHFVSFTSSSDVVLLQLRLGVISNTLAGVSDLYLLGGFYYMVGGSFAISKRWTTFRLWAMRSRTICTKANF